MQAFCLQKQEALLLKKCCEVIEKGGKLKCQLSVRTSSINKKI